MMMRSLPRVFAREPGFGFTVPTRCIATTAPTSSPASSGAGAATSSPVSTFADLLNLHADSNPHKDAFVSKYQNISWTYEELRKHTLAVACGFHDARIRRGKPLLHMTGNDAEHVVSSLAAAENGYIFYPLDPTIEEDALRSALNSLNPRGVIFPLEYPIGGRSNTDLIYKIYPELHQWSVGVPYNLRGSRDLKAIIHTGWDRWAGLMQFRDLKTYDPTPSPLPNDISADEPLFAFASADGTSARLHKNGDVAQAAWKFGVKDEVYSSDDRIMLAAPLHEPGAVVTGLGGGLAAGACMLTHGAVSFNADVAAEKLAQQRCTVLHATTAQLLELMELSSLAKLDTSALQKIVLLVPPNAPESAEVRQAAAEKAKGILGVSVVTASSSLEAPVVQTKVE